MNNEASIIKIKTAIEYEKSRKAPPVDFPPLPDIPVARYTEQKFYELEEKYLWQKTWLYACHSDEIPNAGDYLIWDHGSAPILIVRDKQGSINAFYNTCRHRGAPIVTDKSGNSSGGFMCHYHGWTYSHKGDLLNLRDRRDFVGLDTKCRHLYKVKCEQFGNWVFINEDPQSQSLEEYLGPVFTEFQQMSPSKLRFVEKHGFEVKCNIKILMDAFLEVYHLKSIHQNTVDRFLDHRGSVMTLWPNGHSRMITPWRKDNWVDPGTIGMKEIESVTEIPRTNNCSYNIYPNIITPIDLKGIPFLVFWPKGIDTMYIECHWFSPDLNGQSFPNLWDARIKNFDSILAEDTQFAPFIQQSMQSKSFEGMPLNYQERRIYYWHEELDRRIGHQHIEEAMQVKNLLERYIEEATKDE